MMAFTANVVLIQSLICASLMFGWSSGISVYDPPPRRSSRTHYRGPADVDEYVAATDPPRYNFAYDVSDAYTGDIKSQTETRDGDFVRGQYSLIEPDGTRRVVDYTADEQNGFNAVVSKEGVQSAVAATVAPRPPAAAVPYKPAALSYKPTGAYKPARRPVAYKPSVAAAYRPAPAAIYQQQHDDLVYPTAATANNYYASPAAAAAYYRSTATTYPTTAATAYPAAPLYKSAYKRTLAYDQPPPYYAYRPPHY